MRCCRGSPDLPDEQGPEENMFRWETLERQDNEPEINAKHVWRVWDVLGRTEKLVFPNTDERIGDVFLKHIEAYLEDAENKKEAENEEEIKPVAPLAGGPSIMSLHALTKDYVDLGINDTLLDRLPTTRAADDPDSIRHEFHVVVCFGDLGIDRDKDTPHAHGVIGPLIFGFTGGKLRPAIKRISSRKSIERRGSRFSIKSAPLDRCSTKDRAMTLLGTFGLTEQQKPKSPKNQSKTLVTSPSRQSSRTDPINPRRCILPALFLENTLEPSEMKYAESDKKIFGAFIAYICVFAFRISSRAQTYNLVELFNSNRTRGYSNTEKLQLRLLCETFEKTIEEIVGGNRLWYQKGQGAIVEFLKWIYFKLTRSALGIGTGSHPDLTPKKKSCVLPTNENDKQKRTDGVVHEATNRGQNVDLTTKSEKSDVSSVKLEDPSREKSSAVSIINSSRFSTISSILSSKA